MPLKKLCYLVTSPGTFQQEHGSGLSSTDCQSVTGPRLPAILKSKKDWCSELAVVKTPEESPSDSQLDAMSGVAPEKVLQENGTSGETHIDTVKLLEEQMLQQWYWWRT